MHCPGLAEVKGDDPADRLEGKATITSGSRLWRSEVLRRLNHCLQACKKPRTSRHRSPGEQRRRKRKRSVIFLERTIKMAIVNQTNTETVSKATLHHRGNL